MLNGVVLWVSANRATTVICSANRQDLVYGLGPDAWQCGQGRGCKAGDLVSFEVDTSGPFRRAQAIHVLARNGGRRLFGLFGRLLPAC